MDALRIVAQVPAEDCGLRTRGLEIASAVDVDTNKRCKSCGGTVHVDIVKNQKGGTAAVGTCDKCGRRYEEEELLTLTGHSNPVGG